MRSAERFEGLGVRLVRESRKGVGRGVCQPGPAKQPGDLLTGKGHGNHPLTDLAPAFLYPELALFTGTRCLGDSFPAARRPLALGPTGSAASSAVSSGPTLWPPKPRGGVLHSTGPLGRR